MVELDKKSIGWSHPLPVVDTVLNRSIYTTLLIELSYIQQQVRTRKDLEVFLSKIREMNRREKLRMATKRGMNTVKLGSTSSIYIVEV